MHKNSKQIWTIPFISVASSHQFQNIISDADNHFVQSNTSNDNNNCFEEIVIPKWQKINEGNTLKYNHSSSDSYHRLFSKQVLPKNSLYEPDQEDYNFIRIHAYKFQMPQYGFHFNLLNDYILHKTIEYLEYKFYEQSQNNFQNFHLCHALDQKKQPQVYWVYKQFELKFTQSSIELSKLLYYHWQQRKKLYGLPLLRKYWSQNQFNNFYKLRKNRKSEQNRKLRSKFRINRRNKIIKQKIIKQKQQYIEIINICKKLTLEIKQDINQVQQNKRQRRLMLLQPKIKKWQSIFVVENYQKMIEENCYFEEQKSQKQTQIKKQALQMRINNLKQGFQDEIIDLLSEQDSRKINNSNNKIAQELQQSSIQYESTTSIIQ